MEKRQKLGRGLEEVSHYYLSGVDDSTNPKLKEDQPEGLLKRSISVYCPGSAQMRAFFLTNFALELIRNRVNVLIWDQGADPEYRPASTMKNLIRKDEGSKADIVRLYGLPEIQILGHEGVTYGYIKECIDSNGLSKQGYCLLINTRNDLESIPEGSDVPTDFILLTKVGKYPLLQCYAYIKVICKNHPCATIYIVLDEVQDQGLEIDLYSRFVQHVENKLSVGLKTLGGIVHDEYLFRSIKDNDPLMLFPNQSLAKDSITTIGKEFFRLNNNGN